MGLIKINDTCYVNPSHVTHIEKKEQFDHWVVNFDVPFFGPGGQGFGQHGIVISSEDEVMKLIAEMGGPVAKGWVKRQMK